MGKSKRNRYKRNLDSNITPAQQSLNNSLITGFTRAADDLLPGDKIFFYTEKGDVIYELRSYNGSLILFAGNKKIKVANIDDLNRKYKPFLIVLGEFKGEIIVLGYKKIEEAFVVQTYSLDLNELKKKVFASYEIIDNLTACGSKKTGLCNISYNHLYRCQIINVVQCYDVNLNTGEIANPMQQDVLENGLKNTFGYYVSKSKLENKIFAQNSKGEFVFGSNVDEPINTDIELNTTQDWQLLFEDVKYNGDNYYYPSFLCNGENLYYMRLFEKNRDGHAHQIIKLPDGIENFEVRKTFYDSSKKSKVSGFNISIITKNGPILKTSFKVDSLGEFQEGTIEKVKCIAYCPTTPAVDWVTAQNINLPQTNTTMASNIIGAITALSSTVATMLSPLTSTSTRLLSSTSQANVTDVDLTPKFQAYTDNTWTSNGIALSLSVISGLSAAALFLYCKFRAKKRKIQKENEVSCLYISANNILEAEETPTTIISDPLIYDG